MALLFKASGLATVFLVCVALGYKKSHNIRKRAEILVLIHRSITLFAEYILAENKEIAKLLPTCFGEDFVSVENNNISFKKDYLEKADIDLLSEFFKGLGFNGKNSEYERTRLFASLIKNQSQEANIKAESLCKLYNTLGLLIGTFLCVFFL